MGKKLASIKNKIDQNKIYSLKDAVKIIQENSAAKFDETLDIAIKLGIDAKKSDQNVRGIVKMPAGTGKDTKVVVICEDSDFNLAKKAGAEIVGFEDLIDKIASGYTDFDVCITKPSMMKKIGKIAKILGPKGLMPNPKLGTVSDNLEEAIASAKAGQVEYRSEKSGIIHAGIGKLSFKIEDLTLNIKSFIDAVSKSKPSNSKGVFLKECFLSSTMGLSLKVEFSS
jgi:large subunit ribosomal protein L1